MKSAHNVENSIIGVYYILCSLQITSDHWQSVQTEDIVLRTWDVESAHNYENSMHFTQVNLKA